MRLFQIPFSHNCVKVRHVLDLKGIDYEAVNINPALRGDVKRVSGQTLVPTLVDRGHVVSGSTPILLYLEEHQPEPALLPGGRRGARGVPGADGLGRRHVHGAHPPARLLPGAVRAGPAWARCSSRACRRAAQRVAGAGAALVLRRRFGIDAERNRRDEELGPARGPRGRRPARPARTTWSATGCRSPTSRSPR